ncbi:MAG TPA: tRNA pseudouridine(38-40) synthase TruA [Syntrophothermus lipocalidus]|nr:tRNA pseudouridine(38-40) synthase TruA [Syntrophothermus lipocalidus]
MNRIKALVEYEGTRYSGFQRQPRGLTIEGELEAAICKLTGERVKVLAAGRTDAGVHALGQVIAFDTESPIPPERFAPALNSVLPSDIRVLKSEKAKEGFHPRYQARAKAYRYLIYRQEEGRTFYRNLAYYYPQPLDLPAMTKAARYMEGTHDFMAFCASGSGVRNYVRTVFEVNINEKPPFLQIDVCGDGFLYNMVRIMVGTLLEVGRKRFAPEEVEQILLSRCRQRAGPTVPACGLYLKRVFY